MKVKDVMTKKPVYVKPKDKVSELLHTLTENGISGCPVISRSRVVGIVTQTDVIRWIDIHSKVFKEDMMSLVMAAVRSKKYDSLRSEIRKLLDEPVESLMKDAVTIDHGEDLYSAVSLLDKHDIDRLPVTKSRKLVGILSRSDVIRALEKL